MPQFDLVVLRTVVQQDRYITTRHAKYRMGLRRVILPARNKIDLAEIPESVRRELEFVFADQMEEVLEAALERSPLVKPAPSVPVDPEAAQQAGAAL